MSKREKGKAPAIEAPKPAPVITTPAKATVPGEAKLKEFTPTMSGDLPRPGEPAPLPGDRFKGAIQSSSEFADKSDAGFIARNATAAELEGFVAAVKARRAAEQAAGPKFTFWRCPKCGRQERAGADAKSQDCFFCNSRLLPNGQHMMQVVGEAAVGAFIEREKIEKARWLATLAKAKEIAKKRDRELMLLRRHGM